MSSKHLSHVNIVVLFTYTNKIIMTSNTSDLTTDLEKQDDVISPVTTDHAPITGDRPCHNAWPTIGGGKPYPPILSDPAAYEVDFDGPDDRTHPKNWPFATR